MTHFYNAVIFNYLEITQATITYKSIIMKPTNIQETNRLYVYNYNI